MRSPTLTPEQLRASKARCDRLAWLGIASGLVVTLGGLLLLASRDSQAVGIALALGGLALASLAQVIASVRKTRLGPSPAPRRRTRAPRR